MSASEISNPSLDPPCDEPQPSCLGQLYNVVRDHCYVLPSKTLESTMNFSKGERDIFSGLFGEEAEEGYEERRASLSMSEKRISFDSAHSGQIFADDREKEDISVNSTASHLSNRVSGSQAKNRPLKEKKKNAPKWPANAALPSESTMKQKNPKSSNPLHEKNAAKGKKVKKEGSIDGELPVENPSLVSEVADVESDLGKQKTGEKTKTKLKKSLSELETCKKEKNKTKTKGNRKVVVNEPFVDIIDEAPLHEEPFIHIHNLIMQLEITETSDSAHDFLSEEVFILEKNSWTVEQTCLFEKTLSILDANLLFCNSQLSNSNSLSLYTMFISKSSRKMRNLFGVYRWSYSLLQWLHTCLLRFLPTQMLIIYIEILRVLYNKCQSLFLLTPLQDMSSLTRCHSSNKIVDYIHSNPLHSLPTTATNYLWSFCRKALIVLAPGVLPWSHPSLADWKASLSCLGNVIEAPYVPLKSVARKGFPAACIASLKSFLSEVKGKDSRQERDVLLVGHYMGSRFSCYAALDQKVKAILCLGYPLLSAHGLLPKDPVLRQRCPVFFVLGSRSLSCPVPYLQKLCKQLKSHNSIHVVEGGDDYLRVSFDSKFKMGLTQEDYNQKAVVAAGDFFDQVFSNPNMKKLNAAPEKPPPKRKRKKDPLKNLAVKRKKTQDPPPEPLQEEPLAETPLNPDPPISS
eukprot:Sdes_comp20451_c0_seq1m14646